LREFISSSAWSSPSSTLFIFSRSLICTCCRHCFFGYRGGLVFKAHSLLYHPT
jgi:hypothetical protein